jgi:hypothetical protein
MRTDASILGLTRFEVVGAARGLSTGPATLMHSTGQISAHCLQPIQKGSSCSWSHTSNGKPRDRGASRLISEGY